MVREISEINSFWSLKPEEAFQKLESKAEGLSSTEASQRLKQFGPNVLHLKKDRRLELFLSQFKSPLIALLLFAAVLSFILGDRTESIIIFIIILFSGVLSFAQEVGAKNATQKLLKMVEIKADVKRDGKLIELPIEEIVIGDVVFLNAGDTVPADGLIIQSKNLFVNESSLTGESFAVEKKEGSLAQDTPLIKRTNSVFMGTNVASGTATVLIVLTNRKTEFGKISEKLSAKAPTPSFEQGINSFGYFLFFLTLVLVGAIFFINLFLHRPVLTSFIFALALAVGMTPQLLPAIITVNLSHGAKHMAKKKVIVKKLAAIENFGSMNILCADKTGTITQGTIELKETLDITGNKSDKIHFWGYLNALFQSGYKNPIDEAILKNKQLNPSGWQKLDEIPYDFSRKCIGLAVKKDQENILIVKGALPHLFSICSKVEFPSGEQKAFSDCANGLKEQFEKMSGAGLRLIGLAYKKLPDVKNVTASDEKELVFLGFLTFSDVVKKDIAETLKRFEQRGIALKILTGDHRLVAAHVAAEVGIQKPQLIAGEEIKKLSDDDLVGKAKECNIFAEIEPNQKERIILALRKAGNTVGFLGDGINDITALHTADVGISVENAADALKQNADIILMEKNLSVLIDGVEEGRRTFGNTMKYIFMATSANFGNMFSVAGASLFLPFLPLLPTQILLANLMSDFPEMTISTDKVDHDLLKKPYKWDLKFIRNFMIVFGIISSVFDFMTFGLLMFFFKAPVDQFRTAWFVESVCSASLIILAIRTRKLFFQSMPSRYLVIAIGAVVILTCILPLIPFGTVFAFTPLPLSYYLAIAGVVALYFLSVEIAKRFFYRNKRTSN